MRKSGILPLNPETINYVTSHDNLTLWDKLSRSNPEDSARTRNKMARLAQGIILTAQGIPLYMVERNYSGARLAILIVIMLVMKSINLNGKGKPSITILLPISGSNQA